MKSLPTLRERWNDLSKQWSNDKLSSYDIVVKYCEYIHFTAQKLALCMFVACNSKGEPMEKPEYFDIFARNGDPTIFNNTQISLFKEYQKALDACIFEGWEWKQRSGYSTLQKVDDNIPIAECYDDSKEVDWYGFKTIEDVLFRIPLTLKPNHAKELGLTNN